MNKTESIFPTRSMLVLAAGLLQVSSLAAFPVNPSFAPDAVKAYKTKADAGDAESQYLYSAALANGSGIKADAPQAFVYAKKAADQGYERAFLRLGRGYEEGWSGETNAVKAADCYSRFIAWATKAADQGDAEAQWRLGQCYRLGEGVETNLAEAAKWYRKAADQGKAGAQWRLGQCYRLGKGVETNMTEAVKWYRKAADQGNAGAQWHLGQCYRLGEGVETNLAEAAKWYRKVADQGDAEAQCILGYLYAEGKGVERNLAEAVKWYRKAADQGDADAQFILGLCYEKGVGVKRDSAEAMNLYGKVVQQNRNYDYLLCHPERLGWIVLLGSLAMLGFYVCQGQLVAMGLLKSKRPGLGKALFATATILGAALTIFLAVAYRNWGEVSLLFADLLGDTLAICTLIILTSTAAAACILLEIAALERRQKKGDPTLKTPSYAQYVTASALEILILFATFLPIMALLTPVAITYGSWCVLADGASLVILSTTFLCDFPTRKRYAKLTSPAAPAR